ncbi:unnamed protein product [Adineta steineri]|uniref:BRCT domain-containing protein n=1 Tax=Adineta steineri TaxID=433720 RepID=A0A814JT23_9BILA|nr:unnamed protein product [Adineta steineri]
MSEYNDIAGSEDIISLNFETQDTFNEHSYRNKQSANRIDKNIPIKDQAKENQKPIDQTNDEEVDTMQADTQNYSQSAINNEIATEQPPPSVDTQNTLSSTNPFVIPLPVAQPTLIDENSISVEKDSMPVQSLTNEEENNVTESTSKSTTVYNHINRTFELFLLFLLIKDMNTSGLDISTTNNNLRLYISPSTSLLDTTNADDTQSNPTTAVTTENNDNDHREEELKEEPMDTNDAQVSLGSDGVVESHPISTRTIESTSVIEKSSKVQIPIQSTISTSPNSKAVYSLSQPTADKFEALLAKLNPTTVENDAESNITIREEEEVYIKESISKTLRRYAVKVDQKGRTVSRELILERIVEENTTTRIESWPPSEKKTVRTTAKTTRPTETTRKKPVKIVTPKRKTKSLKPTSTIVRQKKLQIAQSDDDEVMKPNKNDDTSDDDDEVVRKPNINDDSSDDDDDDENTEDDEPTDDITGEEFIPTNSSGKLLTKGLRVFAKWTDGHFYSGSIASINGERYMIKFDDGASRYLKAQDIISRSYLDINQNIMVQTQDRYFERGIIKRLIKKKKTGKLGYIIEKDGKEKWYPLRFISLSTEQAEQFITANNTTEESTNIVQGKRKRASNVPQTPNKKTKSSIFPSPSKKQRTTFTPTRQTKLFNSMYFLLTGFNDLMEIRHGIEDSIESHGGKVIEKMPNANRRENVYLISDKARKTAKFLDAKKNNIPCVDYKWINESIEKSEIQDSDAYKLVFIEKEVTINED